MTIKNIKKNISAEPEHIVTNVVNKDSNPTQNATQGTGNFTKNLAIEITRENFYDEENKDQRVTTIIVPLSELVRIGHLQNQYYTKTEIEGIRAQYYDASTSDERFVAKVYLSNNYYDKNTTDSKINSKVETEINNLNNEIHEEFYTIEEITQLLASLQVGRGKLVTFYIDEANGDIVVQDDGFTYYTTEESNEIFNIDVEEIAPSNNEILKSYQFVQGSGTNRRVLETKINIPKDFLLKNVSLETAQENNSYGITAGHKYFDFIFNTKNNDSNTTHLYLDVNDLTDIYNGDNTTIQKSGNVFSVKKITPSHLDGVLGLNQVTHQDISGKVDKVTGKGLSTEDFTTEEKQKLNGIEAQATKTVIDQNFDLNSENPVQNSVLYQTLLNVRNEYIYLDELGNIHILSNNPTDIELIFNIEGALSVTVTGENIFGEEVEITDAYVDIYDGRTDDYIFTVTSLGNPFIYEILDGYSSVYGKIRDVVSEDVLVPLGVPRLNITSPNDDDIILSGEYINIKVVLLDGTSEGTVVLKSGDTVLHDSLELEETFAIPREMGVQLRNDSGKLPLTAILDDGTLDLTVTKEFNINNS